MLEYIPTKEAVHSSVIILESEVNILCNYYHVCPQVMTILDDMNFTRIRDIRDSSASFDISASHNFKDGQDKEELISKIFERCKGMIHEIQITAKRSSYF